MWAALKKSCGEDAAIHRHGALAAGLSGAAYLLVHFTAPFVFRTHALLYDLLLELFLVLVIVFAGVWFAFAKALRPLTYALWFFFAATLGALYVVVVPTVLDRSLSIYILSQMPADQMVDTDELSRLVEKEYFGDYDVVPIRIVEQETSGNLMRDGDMLQITARGRRVARVTQSYRARLASKYGDEGR